MQLYIAHTALNENREYSFHYIHDKYTQLKGTVALDKYLNETMMTKIKCQRYVGFYFSELQSLSFATTFQKFRPLR